jgi:hypothetical protein
MNDAAPTKKRVPHREETRVYFAQVGEDGPIKIGYSFNVYSRQSNLRTASPFEIRWLGDVPGSPAEERALHAQFAHLRIRGEWFEPAPELLECIAERIAAGAVKDAVVVRAAALGGALALGLDSPH